MAVNGVVERLKAIRSNRDHSDQRAYVSNRRILYFYLTQLVIPAAYLYALPKYEIICGLALIAAFGFCYVISFPQVRARRLWGSAGMTILMWTMMWWFSPDYLALAYYPVAVLAFLELPVVVVSYLMLGCGSGLIILLYVHVYHVHLAGYMIPIAFGGLFSAFIMAFMLRYYSKLHDANDRLANANAEIERLTKVAERERISRDLHDVMGHQLSMISLKAQVAVKVLQRDGDRERTISEISDIERAAREALGRVREYVADMRQADFLEEWQAAEKLLTTAGMYVVMDSAYAGPWEGQSFRVLAMCLREAATNVVRHSQATRCAIRIWRQDSRIHLVIADDGRGFCASDQLSQDGVSAPSSGLGSMRARLDAISGTLHIWSRVASSGPCGDGANVDRLGFAPSTVLHMQLVDGNIPGAYEELAT